MISERSIPQTTGSQAPSDALWAELYRRQLPRVEAHACREYLEGFEALALPARGVPTLERLNARITPRTGWRTVRTCVRYTDARPWYRRFARREFLVTDYMRGWHELEFTPEPDMFHDIFGHLPFFTRPAYARLQELFAPAFARATGEQREGVKRLAWFTTEFGLVRQGGELKAFGAGLISGGAELDNAVRGRVRVLPFDVETVLTHEKAVWEPNSVLFELPPLAELHERLAAYFLTLGPVA